MVERARLSLWFARVGLVAVVLGVAGAYGFFTTVGFTPRTLVDFRYHDRLAEGFAHGQLHILESPSPALLAQKDPYDFQTSRRYWRVWDASLYDGKYYFYWGPVPALIVAALKLVFGADLSVTDRLLVACFQLGRLCVGAVLLVRIRRWFFPQLSTWFLVPALALWGLANPYLYELGRPAVYEAAIDSGQFFLLLGLLLALGAVRATASAQRPQAWLAGAGLCWALAIGCRASLLLAVSALIALTAVHGALQASRPRRTLLAHGALLAAPVGLGLLGLAAYNYARFGSVTDFGTDYMLTTHRYQPQAAFLLPNLYSYLFRPFTVSCEFPLLGAPEHAWDLTPELFHRVPGWAPKEPLVGLLVAIPGLLFAIPAVATAVRWLRARRKDGAPPSTPFDASYVWLVGCCTAIWLLAGLPALGVWFSTMRYLSDVTSAALLLAIVGFATLLSRTRAAGHQRATAVVGLAGLALTLYSIAVSVALGFQGGYYAAFEHLNPALHHQLVERYSVCESEEGD